MILKRTIDSVWLHTEKQILSMDCTEGEGEEGRYICRVSASNIVGYTENRQVSINLKIERELGQVKARCHTGGWIG